MSIYNYATLINNSMHQYTNNYNTNFGSNILPQAMCLFNFLYYYNIHRIVK